MTAKREKKKRKRERYVFFFFFKQKTAYEIYQCDWSSDVCSSDLLLFARAVSAITTQKKEKFAGEHSKRAGQLALESKEALGLARKYFGAYRPKLMPGVDDRLNRATCSALLDKDRKSTRLNSSHTDISRMPSSA